MIQQFASVASDHMPIMSELADIKTETPLGHCSPSGNIRVLAFFEHVLLIDRSTCYVDLLIRRENVIVGLGISSEFLVKAQSRFKRLQCSVIPPLTYLAE